MKIAILGLGSMGKRRIRNLRALGIEDVIGFDQREDRRQEAKNRYGIATASRLEELQQAEAVIISTPPDHHQEYIEWGVAQGKPCFVELNVVLQELRRIDGLAKSKGVMIAPSCTLFFHPAIKQLHTWIASKQYGKITNFVYHSGQYLPDWHPWEDIHSFFVSNPATSGCRELLSFELSWMSKVLGKPQDMNAQGKKVLGFELPSEDTYGVQLSFADFNGVMLIDVVSRFATRNLTLNLEKAQIRWRWEDKQIQLYSADLRQWTSFELALENSEQGYNENLTETMYVEEMRAFLEALQGKTPFPSDLSDDIHRLTLMDKIHQSTVSSRPSR